MHRSPPTTVDSTAKLLHGRDGRIYPIDRLVRGSEALYCELSVDPSRYERRRMWLIPIFGWVVNAFADRRFRSDEGWDWYIDIDRITKNGDRWTIEDGLLDLIVVEGVRGTVLDADEFADDLADGTLAVDDAAYLLRSLHALQSSLARLNWSVAALLAEVAPDLPQ